MKIREFLEIIKAQGFTEKRQRGSHHTYEGFVNGGRHVVTVDYSQLGEDIMPRNLQSMIRQSGLPKKMFR